VSGNPGLSKAREAAQAVGGVLAVPEFGGWRGEKDTDFNDLARLEGGEAVRATFAKVLSGGGADGEAALAALEGEVTRLAELSMAAYALKRAAVAKRFKVPVGLLDKLVAALRPNGDHPAGQGRPLEFPEPEPWPEPVDGAALLDEIEATFQRFIVCEPAALAALTLWSCGTWFEPIAQVAPILNIASPEMRCGKSTALSVTRKLAKRPLSLSNISAAALFRTVEKHSPTLIIDEADSFLGESEELRGLINSGHTSGSNLTLGALV
jgi:putative DNA primase/helicase